MFELIYSDTALKQLKKLDKTLEKRIIFTLERIRIRPYAHVKKIVSSPYFSLRVGDYRVILDVKKDKVIIFVIKLGHRKTIYKDL